MLLGDVWVVYVWRAECHSARPGPCWLVCIIVGANSPSLYANNCNSMMVI